MPETTCSHSTTAPTRRIALAALATGAALSLAPKALGGHGPLEPFSELAVAKLNTRMCWDAHGAAAECEDGSPEQEHHEAVCDDCHDAITAQLKRIAAKPRLSLDDFGALAIILRMRSAENPTPEAIRRELATEDWDDASWASSGAAYAALLLTAGILDAAEGQANG